MFVTQVRHDVNPWLMVVGGGNEHIAQTNRLYVCSCPSTRPSTEGFVREQSYKNRAPIDRDGFLGDRFLCDGFL